MSAITDARDKSEANFALIRTGIQALNDKLIALSKQPAPALSPEDQAALAQIVADSNALAQAAQLVP